MNDIFGRKDYKFFSVFWSNIQNALTGSTF